LSERRPVAKKPEKRSGSSRRREDVSGPDAHGRADPWPLDLEHVVKAFGSLTFPLPLNEPPLLLWLKISGRIDRWRAAPVCLRCRVPSGQSGFERWAERSVLCSLCALEYERGVSLPALEEALAGLVRRRGRSKDVEASPEFLELYVQALRTSSARGKRPTVSAVLRYMNRGLPRERQLALRTLQEKLTRYGL
jgi:hypothetical protein